MGAIGDVFLRVRADLKEFEAEIQAAARKGGTNAAQTFGQHFGKAGAAMQNFGRTLTTNVTLPVVGLGVVAAKVGSDFEDTMNQLVGLANVPRGEIEGIREELLKLGPAIGKTPQEPAEAFYFVASSGFEAKDALDVVTKSARLSAAGMGQTQDIAKVLSASINAYGAENLTAARAADVLTAAVTEGSAEADQFANALGVVIPTAATMGVSIDQVTGALAAMTLSGLDVNEATTSLNQVMISLLNPTTEAEKALGDLGTSSKELRQELKEKGLLVTLRDLEARFEGNDEAAGLVFGNVRALRGVLNLLGLDSEKLNSVMAHTETALGDEAKAYEATEGSSREYQRAMAELQVLLIELSEDVLPVAVDLLRQIGSVARTLAGFWRQLSPETRGIVVQLLALAAVVGPLTLVFGKLTSGFGLFLRTIGGAGKLIAPVVKVFGRLGLTLATAVGESLASSAAGQAVASGVTKMLASGPVTAAASLAGRALGLATATAIPLGLAAGAAAIGAGIALLFKAIVLDPGLQQQTRDIGKSVDEQIATGVGDLEQSRAALQTGIDKIKALPFGEFLYGDQIRDLQAQIDNIDKSVADKAKTIPKTIATALEYGQSEVDVSARMMVNGISAAVVDEGADAGAEAKKVGGYVATGVGAGILEQQGAVDTAMATLTNLIKNERTPAQQASHVIGQLISKEVSNGVVSGRPGVKDAARSLRESGEQELRAFIAGGGKIGKKAMTELRDGMKSKDPEVRNQSKRTLKIIDQELDKLKGVGKNAGEGAGSGVKTGIDNKRGAVRGAAGAYRTAIKAQLPSSSEGQRWGSGLGNAYAGGIRSSKKWAVQAARNTALAVAAILKTSSPPGPLSPLHHIVDWARETMQFYAGGLESQAGVVQKAAVGAVDGARYALTGNEFDATMSARVRSSIVAPGAAIAQSMTSGVLAATGARTDAEGGKAGGVVYNYNMPVQGALPVRTPRDTVAAMRRISEIGELPPKTLSPQYPRQSSEVRP